MTWAYRDIQTFPMRYGEAMREAVASLNEPIVFGFYPSKQEANAVASSFRHYRWCLRQRPDTNVILGNFEAMFDFRISSERVGSQCALYLLAQPTKLSELMSLNPHLDDLISSACQP